MDTLGTRIRKARKDAGLSQGELGKQFGITREAVSLWEADTNAPTMDKLGTIAKRLGVSAEWLLTGKGAANQPRVAVAGYVGAGAEVHPIDDFPGGSGLEMVPPPPGETNCVAVRIRGDSMHPLQDGWLVFYSRDQDGVPDDAVGKVCVVKVKDGPTLIKTLRRGSGKNRWTLESWNGPTRENVVLEWASRVLDIRPV